MSARGRWSIRTTVFVAPSIIIVLMLVAMLMSDLALRKQQASYHSVVQGPLTVATTTATRLLLLVSEVQAAVLRYAQLRQRLAPDDAVLGDLRESIIARYEDIATAIDSRIMRAAPIARRRESRETSRSVSSTVASAESSERSASSAM